MASVYPLVDAKITQVIMFPQNRKVQKKLVRNGLMAPKAMEVEFARHCAYVDLYGNSTTWGTFRKYLQIVHVIKPSSPFTMFYHLMQPSESFTSIVSTKDPHQLIFDDKFFFDNFDVAWRGYEFALHIREKIRTGDATIFPVISEGAR